MKRLWIWLKNFRRDCATVKQACYVYIQKTICASWDLLPISILSSRTYIRGVPFELAFRGSTLWSTSDVRWRGWSERSRLPEKREKARATKIDSNRYLNTKIVEEVSHEKRTRDGDRKGSRTERYRGGESDSSFCWEYISSLLSLSLSSRGYLHLGPTLAAPAIP